MKRHERIIFVNAPEPRPERPKITPITEGRIRKATSLLAAGRTWIEAATAVQLAPSGLKELQKLHPELWAQEYERGIQAAIVMVRRIAGTTVVADDPETYIRQAMRCEKWARDRGEELFPASDVATVASFFRTYYKPVRLSDTSTTGNAKAEGIVRRWVLLTGDPPLSEVTVQTLSHFRDCLQKLPGKSGITRMAVATVRGHLRMVQTLLDKAGPPGPRNRDAADIIARPPWIKPPRPEYTVPRIVPQEHLEDVYRSAMAMEIPRIDGFKPSAWWRALLVLTFNTGLRRRSLFAIRMAWIDWKNRTIQIPPQSMKSRRGEAVHLNDAAIQHLLRIRTDRERLFPWPYTMVAFNRAFHRLQDVAGLHRRDHFGLHDIRRLHATLLWENSPAAAQYSLGHASIGTTLRHYVAGQSIVARAIDQLPQPAAFTVIRP